VADPPFRRGRESARSASIVRRTSREPTSDLTGAIVRRLGHRAPEVR